MGTFRPWSANLERVSRAQTEREAAREIADSMAKRAAMRRAFSGFSDWRNEGKRREAIRQFVTAPSVKLAHVARLWQEELAAGSITSLQLVAKAKAIKINEPTRERAVEMLVPKSRGGFRRVYNFSREARAKQLTVKDALAASRHWSDHQFALNRGPLTARRAVCRAMARPDLNFAIIGDIQDFYGSVSQDAAMEMSLLPEQVAKAVLLPSSYRFVGRESRESSSLSSSHGQQGPLASGDWTGLMQGSAISPYLSEIVIADLRDLVEDIAGKVPFFASYSDDHLMLSETEERAASLHRALEDVLSSHPAGPFRLRGGGRIVSFEEGFEFLGCRFRRSDGRVSVEVIEDRAERFFERLLEEADEAFDGAITHGARVPNMLAGAEGAFPDAPRFLARLAEMRRILNVPR